MKRNKLIDAKNQSMEDHDDASRESKTGYLDRGNPAEVRFEARAKRNDDNGSHY